MRMWRRKCISEAPGPSQIDFSMISKVFQKFHLNVTFCYIWGARAGFQPEGPPEKGKMEESASHHVRVDEIGFLWRLRRRN